LRPAAAHPCAATKSDKLTRSEQAATLAAVRKELAPLGEQVTVQLFSSLKKTGIEEAERVVGSWLSCRMGTLREAVPE
jgi:GTP-binding protein